jgi:hypothetical protein
MTAPHNPKDYRNTCEEIAAARKWNDARLAARSMGEMENDLAEALSDILEALSQKDEFGQRYLTIEGPAYYRQWIVDAESDAVDALKAWMVSTQNARLAAMKPRVADTPWLVRHGKWLLSAMAALGAVIVWRVLL